ncbi:sarcosine oxidase subunit gamma [Allorhizobium undicola]|uniref:sarcosine oxidase subunit gamma n=1 Tax=Allorhizobium undicola TaxID=78527 RepID=UPI003D340424
MLFVERHPLEDFAAGFSAVAGVNHLAVPVRPAIFAVLSDISPALLDKVDFLPLSPGQWLAFSTELTLEALFALLRQASGPEVAVIAKSDAYAVLRLTGPHSRRLLNSALALDLHPDAFGAGQSACSLFHQVPVVLLARGGDGFDLLVPRSFAAYVYEEIMAAGRVHGLTAGFLA